MRALLLFMGGVMLIISTGCTAVKTFPMTARAGDTITLGLGFDAMMARKEMNRTGTVVTVEKDDMSYTAVPSLRGLFHLYPDPNSNLANYEDVWLESLSLDGNPFETVVVFDLPTDIPVGNYNVRISSPNLIMDYTYGLEVISGTGARNPFIDSVFGMENDLTNLENVPGVSVALDPGYTIGALTMVIDFDETLVSPSGINVQLPRYVVGPGKFQDFQRLMYWSDDGLQLTVNILCPIGVSSREIGFDIIYPQGSPDPLFTITSQKVYDVNGNEIVGVGATLN